MSHNCRLKSKTGLRRSGITRTENRQCSKSEGPRVVKPGKRLRRKSKSNSNRHVDLNFRLCYMAENYKCEMVRLFPESRLSSAHHSIPQNESASKILYVRDFAPSTDPHHILWGQARRHDIRANLLAICREAHDFCHKFKVDGLVLALEAKRQNLELDWTELDRISGKSIRGYLSTKRCTFPWCEVYRLALVGEESC